MPRWQTFALSVDKRDFRETSQIVQFLTEDRGLVACLARGAYREKNSYEGPIDLLVYGRITGVSRQRGAGLDLLTGRAVLTNFPEIRWDLRRYRAATHLLWLLREGLREGQMIEGLFALVRAACVALNDRPLAELGAIIFAFEWRLLRMLGMAPVVTACVVCGRRRDAAPSRPEDARGPAAGANAGGGGSGSSGWAFSAARGGLVCRRCRLAEPATRGLSRAASALLVMLERAPAARLAADPLYGTGARELRRLFDEYWSYRLERAVSGARWLGDLPGG